MLTMSLADALAFCNLKRGDVFWLRRADEYPVRRVPYLCDMNSLPISNILVCGVSAYVDSDDDFRGMEFVTVDFTPVEH